MEHNRAKALIAKYLSGNCTPEEKIIVESWYTKELSAREDQLPEPDYDKLEQEIWDKLPQQKIGQTTKIWPRIAIAASVLLFLYTGFYFFEKRQRPLQTAQSIKHEIVPGSTKAVLILGNGKKLVLNNAKNGLLAMQGSAEVQKTATGEVIYTNTEPGTDVPLYNTMTTPVGGEYRLTLADGTQVWLNAASSIKYPTAFKESERKVEITGEVYFEVAHDAAKPFLVITGKQTVEVLGTHFNINAYPDESTVKTTLLTGSIRISSVGKVALLKPGEQSQVNERGGITKLDHANIEEAVSWKNGYFRFNNENIRSVMHKLSRWYDVDIKYDGAVSDEGYYGTISKYKTISEVLEMLQQTKGVHFKIEGRRIVVTG
ncbi:FecR family protein [Mucilaginibacter gracilis]|uniref:FecR family protein n=1 Tax=Mucilaginibacter gracilis TaxID=423350 RepID=A0A495IUW8_9SPHI|nr:FecR family protein [Mucilaginibacter gracilis]RKR80362.1 FecR family protein [Mucilaginibacter gracilis]